jgi:HEXXH motif-containing protein
LAEAIVHESQHGKLNTLRWLDPVLENGDATWTSSPVRPDMRPLMGVLMAVHAFVPVAALHQRLRELDHPLADPERRAQVIAGNADGLVTLRELAKPTALGKRVIAALEELHAATSSA